MVVDETIPHFMEAFETLVKSSLSQEVMRALSLFVTYAFHSPPSSLARTPKPSSASSRPATLRRMQSDHGSSASSTPTISRNLPKKKLGIRILVMYSDILCEKGNMNHIKKFARTVTNKV